MLSYHLLGEFISVQHSVLQIRDLKISIDRIMGIMSFHAEMLFQLWNLVLYISEILSHQF